MVPHWGGRLRRVPEAFLGQGRRRAVLRRPLCPQTQGLRLGRRAWSPEPPGGHLAPHSPQGAGPKPAGNESWGLQGHGDPFSTSPADLRSSHELQPLKLPWGAAQAEAPVCPSSWKTHRHSHQCGEGGGPKDPGVAGRGRVRGQECRGHPPGPKCHPHGTQTPPREHRPPTGGPAAHGQALWPPPLVPGPCHVPRVFSWAEAPEPPTPTASLTFPLSPTWPPAWPCWGVFPLPPKQPV